MISGGSHPLDEREIEQLTAELAEARRQRDEVWGLVKGARNAARRMSTVLIACADRLDVPFTNADGSPWTLTVKPALERLQYALGMRGAWPSREEIDESSVNAELADINARVAADKRVLDAADGLLDVERRRSPATEDSSIWLEAHAAALGELVAAVDARRALTGEQADRG